MPIVNSLRLPDFLGVGPPRTGTTWLHTALSGHVGLPQGLKETDFFVHHYNKGLEWYSGYFRNCPLDRLIGEFSPNYFAGMQTRERIARHIPGCRIICTLRDPVERIYSSYRKLREEGHVSGSFEEFLEKRPDLLEWSNYASHVKAWQALLGTQNTLVLLQEDLKASPQNYLNGVCDFLRIPRIAVANSRARKVYAAPRLPRYPRLARMAVKVSDHLQAHGGYAYTVVNLLKKAGVRDFLFSGPAFEPIRPETDARLRKLFLPEVVALEELLGRSLPSWKTAHRMSDPGIRESCS